MKFWTADSEDLVVDMVECEVCQRWIPSKNAAIHSLYHAHQPIRIQTDDNGDSGLPSFVMQTIPCEDCRVLVPRGNWEIHRAHVCRGRQQAGQVYNNHPAQEEQEEPQSPNDNPPVVVTMETVECSACGILVPIHNLELHETRACSALHTVPPTGTANLDTTSDANGGCSFPLIDDKDEEGWKCPRCTFQNSNTTANQEKCSMCEYQLVSATESSNHNPQKDSPPSEESEKEGWMFWKSVVKDWVPVEYHQLLPEHLVPERERKKRKKKRGKRLPRQNNTSEPPPSRQEIRQCRSVYLDWLERERRQYVQLLETTRQQYLCLKQQQQQQQQQQEPSHEDEPMERLRKPSDDDKDEASRLPQSITPPTQLELLQATEQLCLHHLEYLRRTRVIQQLKQDIELLGLPRWKHHLQHLLDLYQSASELYVDNIIWELRMQFMRYAVLEIMAMLELAIWSAQIQSMVASLGQPMDGGEARRACRNSRDISIICQSVMPFLGRPQTPALRGL